MEGRPLEAGVLDSDPRGDRNPQPLESTGNQRGARPQESGPNRSGEAGYISGRYTHLVFQCAVLYTALDQHKEAPAPRTLLAGFSFPP